MLTLHPQPCEGFCGDEDCEGFCRDSQPCEGFCRDGARMCGAAEWDFLPSELAERFSCQFWASAPVSELELEEKEHTDIQGWVRAQQLREGSLAPTPGLWPFRSLLLLMTKGWFCLLSPMANTAPGLSKNKVLRTPGA